MPPAAIDGRRSRSAGSRRSSAVLENRRWPPGVVKTRRRPASLHRRSVAGETPRTRLAWESGIQSGSRNEGGATQNSTNVLIHGRLAQRTMCLRGALTVSLLPPSHDTARGSSSFDPGDASTVRRAPRGSPASHGQPSREPSADTDDRRTSRPAPNDNPHRLGRGIRASHELAELLLPPALGIALGIDGHGVLVSAEHTPGIPRLACAVRGTVGGPRSILSRSRSAKRSPRSAEPPGEPATTRV